MAAMGPSTGHPPASGSRSTSPAPHPGAGGAVRGSGRLDGGDLRGHPVDAPSPRCRRWVRRRPFQRGRRTPPTPSLKRSAPRPPSTSTRCGASTHRLRSSPPSPRPTSGRSTSASTRSARSTWNPSPPRSPCSATSSPPSRPPTSPVRGANRGGPGHRPGTGPGIARQPAPAAPRGPHHRPHPAERRRPPPTDRRASHHRPPTGCHDVRSLPPPTSRPCRERRRPPPADRRAPDHRSAAHRRRSPVAPRERRSVPGDRLATDHRGARGGASTPRRASHHRSRAAASREIDTMRERIAALPTTDLAPLAPAAASNNRSTNAPPHSPSHSGAAREPRSTTGLTPLHVQIDAIGAVAAPDLARQQRSTGCAGPWPRGWPTSRSRTTPRSRRSRPPRRPARHAAHVARRPLRRHPGPDLASVSDELRALGQRVGAIPATRPDRPRGSTGPA